MKGEALTVLSVGEDAKKTKKPKAFYFVARYLFVASRYGSGYGARTRDDVAKAKGRKTVMALGGGGAGGGRLPALPRSAPPTFFSPTSPAATAFGGNTEGPSGARARAPAAPRCSDAAVGANTPPPATPPGCR